MAENSLYKIGITHGDINGIGYEVIIKALADNKIMDLCIPVVYGLAKVATYYKKSLDLHDFNFQFIKNLNQVSVKKSNLLNLSDQEIKLEVGNSTDIAGKMARLSLENACKDLQNNMIDAIVTAPINKSNIQGEGFQYPGHTEYLTHFFNSPDSLMMMVAESVKIGFATNHIPLKTVAKTLTGDLILKKLRILNKSLVYDFGSTNPKIAVLSLNPHAGDHGLTGNEESEIIAPAISKAFDEKINTFGPFPADGFFGAGKYRQFDAVLALYHDQGMIPFKLLSMDEGVNYTAGLPVVRTSPAHGTAYELAGKNQSSGQSFRNAVYLALDILKNRQNLKGNNSKNGK